MNERTETMEPGVYKTEDGKFGFLAATRTFEGGLSRSVARKLSQGAGYSTTTKGIYIPPAEIVVEVPIPEETPENTIDVQMPEPYGDNSVDTQVPEEETTEHQKRPYVKHNFKGYKFGDIMAEIPVSDKRGCSRFYMAAYMHRRNHPDSGFDFNSYEEDGNKVFVCMSQ